MQPSMHDGCRPISVDNSEEDDAEDEASSGSDGEAEDELPVKARVDGNKQPAPALRSAANILLPMPFGKHQTHRCSKFLVSPAMSPDKGSSAYPT